MDAKEKAEEIIRKYSLLTGYSKQSANSWMLREMALIAIDEIIKVLPKNEYMEDLGKNIKNREILFWEQVKTEINLI